ncbi:gremlin-1-like [Lampetra planeri]
MTWPRSPLFLLLLSSISLLLAETSSDPSRPRNRDSGSRDKSHGDSDVRSLMGGSEMSYKDEEIRPDIRDADSEAADRHSEIRHRDSDIRDADSDIRLEIRDQESRIRHRDPDIRSEIRDKGSRIRHRDSRSRGIDEDITSSGRTFFPQGAIPPPGKGRSNISSSHGHVARHHHQHHQQQQQMLALGLPGGPSSHFHDRDAERQVLASSHEALFVTERRYLRRDWCKSQPLRQTVRERGCVPRTVINRFCYGQCNSFYIPRRATADDDSFRACAACRPQRFSSLTVELSCPGLEPPLRRVRLSRVKHCRCVSVRVHD